MELGVSGVAYLRRRIRSCVPAQAGRRGKHQRLIVGFVVAWTKRPSPGLRRHLHRSVQEFHYVGYVEVMLVESCKKENLIFLDRTANRCPALLLPAMRLKSHKSVSRAESTVPNVVKTRPVPVIRP